MKQLGALFFYQVKHLKHVRLLGRFFPFFLLLTGRSKQWRAMPSLKSGGATGSLGPPPASAANEPDDHRRRGGTIFKVGVGADFLN